MLEIRHVREHVEVFLDGVFIFSADTESEARRELFMLCCMNNN